MGQGCRQKQGPRLGYGHVGRCHGCRCGRGGGGCGHGDDGRHGHVGRCRCGCDGHVGRCRCGRGGGDRDRAFFCHWIPPPRAREVALLGPRAQRAWACASHSSTCPPCPTPCSARPGKASGEMQQSTAPRGRNKTEQCSAKAAIRQSNAPQGKLKARKMPELKVAAAGWRNVTQYCPASNRKELQKLRVPWLQTQIRTLPVCCDNRCTHENLPNPPQKLA